MITRYVNTASTGGDGTTNETTGATAAFTYLSGALDTLDNTAHNDDLQILCCGTAADPTSDYYINCSTNWSYLGTTYKLIIKICQNNKKID